jgi:hypothetical protein
MPPKSVHNDKYPQKRCEIEDDERQNYAFLALYDKRKFVKEHSPIRAIEVDPLRWGQKGQIYQTPCTSSYRRNEEHIVLMRTERCLHKNSNRAVLTPTVSAGAYPIKAKLSACSVTGNRESADCVARPQIL